MTTPDPTEKRSVTLQLRLTPTEAAPWKAQVDKDHHLSDVVRGVLNDATAVPQDAASRVRGATGRRRLHRDRSLPQRIRRGVRPLPLRPWPGEARRHDHPGLRVHHRRRAGLRQGATYENGKLGEMFMLSLDEHKEIDEILGAASEPTRQGVEAGEKIKRETLAETGEFKPTTKLGRAAQGLMYWRGGCAAAEAGCPYGSKDHQAFFMGFMEGITGR